MMQRDLVLLRRTEVERMSGLRAATIYRHRRANQFPQPIKYPAGMVRWVKDAVERQLRGLPWREQEVL